MPRPLFRFRIVPSLPEALAPLSTLAMNLHWEWDGDTLDLFRRLDTDLWEATGHNPVLMLGHVDQNRLLTLANDDGFLAQMDRAQEGLNRYMQRRTNHATLPDLPGGGQIAYFSAEFGITECLQIYAGGLGVLAADHLKSASDLGLPLVGVGLLYQEGYFRQYLNPDGWQQERYPRNDFHNLPIEALHGPGDTQQTVVVDFPGRQVKVQLWKAQVGRVPLILLDTNIPDNWEEDRAITNQLYGGGNEKRIQQEIVLGIGGTRALRQLGYKPTVYHMNEGHSAFLALERIRILMEERGLSFDEAKVLARAGIVFTTHTPVSAGSDYFPPDYIDRYLGSYYDRFGLPREQFLALGRLNPNDQGESFCTTLLALRLSGFRFGVSKLHEQVSRRIWHGVWPELPEKEVPIDHVTNGVHTSTWASLDMSALLERYLGPRWHEAPNDKVVWGRVAGIPDEELWRTHERRRERLVAFTRQRLHNQLQSRGAPPAEVDAAMEALSPDALTIGFARRFATYKRANLLLRDPDRLIRILTNREQPVQIIIAGKAHPADDPGKDIIRQIVHFARRLELRRSIIFVEDYDMIVARYLVQGVDIWLNNPRRPLEASGTSGMKATLNGALNISVLDGWWDEAYRPEDGWAIGRGEDYDDAEKQDAIEADALYHLLESEVVPLFYRRGADRLPREWIAKVKSAMHSICPTFNTHRMVSDYYEQGYIKSARRYERLASDNAALGRQVATWQARVRDQWRNVRIERVESEGVDPMPVGSLLTINAHVRLGGLSPNDVAVELYHGPLDHLNNITVAETQPMTLVEGTNGDTFEYAASVTCNSSGLQGYTVRVVPTHPEQADRFVDGFVRWAE